MNEFIELVREMRKAQKRKSDIKCLGQERLKNIAICLNAR